MPQPQPGADRPADGDTPVTGRDPGIAEPAHSPVPPSARKPGDADPTAASPTEGATPAPHATPAPAPADTPSTTDPATGSAGTEAPSTAGSAPGPAATTDAPPATGPAPEPATDTPATDTPATDTEPATDAPVSGAAGTERQAAGPTDDPGEAAEVTPARGSFPVRPAGVAAVPARPTGSAAVPGRPTGSAAAGDPSIEVRPAPGPPDPTRVPARPDPTRVDTRAEAPAPRWSGSAAVPPPPPRRPAWGESAEPTPLPPLDSPEHAVPVDPWEGVDTTGWDLHSVEFSALPPTRPYPALPPTRPYPAPPHTPPSPAPPMGPTPVSPPPVSPPPVAARPYPPPAAQPLPQAGPRPVSPPAPAPARQRRGRPAPPVTAPPGWRPPKGYVAVPVRRRRRWPWVLLLTVACCCGVPLWWAAPVSSQYPASAALPDRAHDLRLRDDKRSRDTAEQLRNEVREAHLLAEDTFAGVYGTNDGKRVTLFGGTGFRLTPESDADAEIARLKDQYALGDTVSVETDVRGRYERCAVGRADGEAVVVCTSVDHGSLATGVFTRLSVGDSARLLDRLRTEVITVKQS